MEDSDKDLKIHAEKTAEALVQKLKTHSITVALAESCTAGMVSSLLANVAGASSVLWGSFVCYTQEAKISMLGLDNDELSAYGLVSGKTASSMASCALQKSGADIAAAVTGLAGPDGDGSGVPVGTVWIASAVRKGKVTVKEFHFEGSRNAVRIRAAIAILEIIESLAS
ncbi:MAG: nicotinamide-nucleotide amidohydrolase family protein [Treponema sp.]|jgi:PncC family amidohydrolase|nr:nicotinamide-nucleotide amidohydrolase family protein [Treponema sp.]